MPLGEGAATSHYIFYSVKYFFLVHYALLLTIKSLIPVSDYPEITFFRYYSQNNKKIMNWQSDEERNIRKSIR